MGLLVFIAVLMALNSFPHMEEPIWGISIVACLALMWQRPTRMAIPRELMGLLAFPFLLFSLSLHGIYSHPLGDFGKDCWYFTLPLVYLALGYLAFERVGSWQRLMQPLILAGLGVGTYAILHAALNRGELAAAATVDAYRAITGGGTFGPMIPMVLILMARKARLPEFGVERWQGLRWAVYAVSTGAVLITFSRTHMVTLAAGVICALNYKSVTRRLLFSGGIPMVIALAVLAGGVYGLSHAKSGPVELFVKKVMNSSSEVQVRAFETYEQINQNWRGYEAYRAEKTFDTYSLTDKIFGDGSGAMVNLGFAMQLSPTESFQYVPITHNGYMYILIKDGIVGIALFALFMLQLLWMARQSLRMRDPEAKLAGLVLIWTPIVMIATQGVITGIYNKGEMMPVLFLTGAAVASYARRRRAFEAAGHEPVWQIARTRPLGYAAG